MAERDTAEARLERLLYILPAGSREGGVALDELADALGVDARQVLRDLAELTEREFYHPAGSGGDLQITIEPGRVSVWTTGDFRRPIRLSPREALALDLGLRALVGERGDDRLVRLARRLEVQLASQPAEALLPRFELGEDDSAGTGLLALVREAVRERRRCRIRYLSAAAEAPTDRVICPYVIAIASGSWYMIAHCCRTDSVRTFRHDRILEAAITEETFEVPAGFDPADHLADGRVFRADDTIPVEIRYSPRIARWILEHSPAESQADGSVIVRHEVADPEWAVRHVLGHGPDAEVLSPPEVREAVAAAVERLLQ